MKKAIGTYLLLLAGIFILAHVAVPHHHHWDAIFLESQEEEQEHHGDHQALDEIMVFAFTRQQIFANEIQVAPVGMEPIKVEIPSVPVVLVSSVPIYYHETFYQSFRPGVKALRGPPSCVVLS